jgi:hypothetical protein
MAYDPLLRWDWEGGAPGHAAGAVERSLRVSSPAAVSAPPVVARHDHERAPKRPLRRRR